MRVLLFILFCITLTGCGGGSSETKDNNTTSPPVTPEIPETTLNTISGSVVDGPILGASVCLDSNNDFSCDGELYQTTTDENGYYSLDIPADTDINLNLISVGGTDVYTSKVVPTTFALKLYYLNQTDPTANFITPISTLVSSLYETLLLNESLDETTRSNYLRYFTNNLYINPINDNDVFLANQEVLLAYAFYNTNEIEQQRATIGFWQAAPIIARLSGLQYRIFVSSSYSSNYNNLYSALQTRLTVGDDQFVVQNFLLQAIESLATTSTTGMTNRLAQKVMTEHKSITLNAPEPTSQVQANYINLQWTAVEGATEYRIYDDNTITSAYTTKNNYITIPIPYNFENLSKLTLRFIAENALQVSPETTMDITARGVTNSRPPLFNNITVSKGDSQIDVCFDFPEIDFNYLVGGNEFYYTTYLYIKDNDKGFRPTGRLDVQYDSTVVDNRYCFASLNMATTRPVEFKVESHLRDREGNYAYLSMPSNDFGYASTDSDSTLRLSAFGLYTSTATLVWSNIAEASEYVVYLSDSASMSNRSELFRSYSTKTSFDLPDLILKDRYYLQIEAILNDGNSLSSNIVAYDGFKNRNTIARSIDNSTINQYIFSISPEYPTRFNMQSQVYFTYAMNSDLPNVFSPSFEALSLDTNGTVNRVLFTDYSDVLKAMFVERGYAWEGWAIGEPYIYSQGIYETITPDYNSVNDDDHDNVVNINDTCLQTPLGIAVDSNGCSVYELRDSDSDGVLNYLDSCMGTPVAYSIDSNGCASFQLNDFDNDNVDNGSDICPHDTWDGVNVDYSASSSVGCSLEEGADSDGDGVINYADTCPFTPAEETANSGGCSHSQITDSDNDGVVDQYDLCLATPNQFIKDIDIHGCYSEEVNDDDSDGVVNILDSCTNTPSDLIVYADGCAAEEINDDDNDGVVNYYDECAATPSNVYVLRNGCDDATKPDVNIIACDRPVMFQPEYFMEWEPLSAYDGYEVTYITGYVGDVSTNNTSISGSYPYFGYITVRPYYYKRKNAFVDTQRSYGTAETCEFKTGMSPPSSSDPIVFTQSDYNTKQMESSTTQTDPVLPQQNVNTTIEDEAYMFVFTYNGYWWGAGPVQSVSTGYGSAEEVIALVEGKTCKQPRKFVNNVTALTNNGNEVSGTFFYCGKPLSAGDNLDILKLYRITSGI